MDPVLATRRWIERAVIGLDLCPFARDPYEAGLVRIAVSPAHDVETAVEAALDEARALLESSVSTTLVVFPSALEDFEVFLDAVEAVEATLSAAGADGVLQVASFHPEYRFEGEDEIASHTNRSPFPTIHLLREADVSEAVDRHPDPGRIPKDNVARLSAMGAEALARLWSGFTER